MRHPLWILNSALFFLLLSTIIFVIFSQVSLPEWEDITPKGYATPLQKKASEVRLNRIYEFDLFGTYEKPLISPEEPTYITPLTPPPTPRQIIIPKEPMPQFLDPLQITLKGVIVVLNDDSKNRAIISDIKTKKEELYKVGDSIEDAQLIKIFGKKVILLRSNGQQEVLYLRPKDAQMDPAYAFVESFKNIAKEISENTYLINPKEFALHIKNLAQFIDLLDLTTVYQQGESIGCRVGKSSNDSFAHELGLQPGDIIESINSIPATTSQNRFAIYKEIVAMQTKDSIVVDLIRDGQEVQLTYRLENFKTPKASGTTDSKVDTVAETRQEQINILRERQKFAPTLQEIRAQERQNMLKKSQSSRNSLTSKFAE